MELKSAKQWLLNLNNTDVTDVQKIPCKTLKKVTLETENFRAKSKVKKVNPKESSYTTYIHTYLPVFGSTLQISS